MSLPIVIWLTVFRTQLCRFFSVSYIFTWKFIYKQLSWIFWWRKGINYKEENSHIICCRFLLFILFKVKFLLFILWYFYSLLLHNGWDKLPAHLVLLLSLLKLLSQLFFISVLLVTCLTFPPFRLLGKSITVSSHNLNLQAPNRKMSCCFHTLSFHVGLQLFLIGVLFLGIFL